MNLWIGIEAPHTPTQAESVFVLVQYAPDPSNTYTIQGYYEDGTFYNLETGEPIQGPIIAWTPTTPNRK